MSTVPKVSVIIPAYNNARFLQEAVESVFAQTYQDYEIIVIDDGSTDNTKEVLAPYLDRIQYIYQPNRGASSARNTGIRHSHGDYIAFLDADDIWLPEKLRIQVEYLNNHPDTAMVYALALRVDVNGRASNHRNMLKRSLPCGDIFNALFFRDFITLSSVVIRKRILDAIGLFDESFTHAEDHELWLRIARQFKIFGIGEYLCKYRLTPQSLGKRNKDAAFTCKRRVIEKHYKLSQDLCRPISQALYKKAIGHFFFRVGRYYSRQGNEKIALEHFLLSLKYSRFSLRSLKTLKYCFTAYFNMVLAMK